MRASRTTLHRLRARRRLAELERLCELEVSIGAATVLAEELSRRWHRRGDTAQAYERHRSHASPVARERHAIRHRRQRAAARRAAS